MGDDDLLYELAGSSDDNRAGAVVVWLLFIAQIAVLVALFVTYA